MPEPGRDHGHGHGLQGGATRGTLPSWGEIRTLEPVMRWLVGMVSLGLVILPVPVGASPGKGTDHGAERGADRGTDQAKPDRGGGRGDEREAPTLEPFFASGPASKAAAHFRAGDFLAASQEAGRVLAHLPRHAPERSQLQFLRGLALISLSSWPEAQTIFEELWSSYPLLAPYHAYHAARCHFQEGDVEGALAWLERVPEGSVPEAEATMLKVDALIKTRRWAEVDTVVEGYLARFPKGPRRTEALFDHAEALQALGRPIAEIAAAYRGVWAEATAESWATRASDRLAELAKAAPPSAAPGLSGHTADELVGRGMLLFDANQNTEAEAIFTSALAKPDLDAATRCKLRFHLAQSVWKQRQRARAAPLFDSAIADCRTAGEDDLLVRSLYQGARSYAAAGNRDRAVALYAEIEREHPDHHLTDDARLRAAEVLADAGQKTEAERLLVDLADLYPKGDMAPEALWRLALSKWQAQSYDQALYWLDQILRRYPREDIWYADGRALYWKARVLEKQGEAKRALASYLRAVHEYPLSAYTLFSFQRLQRYPRERSALMRELRAQMRGKAESTAWSFGRQAIFAQLGFRRAVELARLGLGNETRRELAHLGLDLGNKNPGEAGAGHESGGASPSARRERQRRSLLDSGRPPRQEWAVVDCPHYPAHQAGGLPPRLPRRRTGRSRVAHRLSQGLSRRRGQALPGKPRARGASVGHHARRKLLRSPRRILCQRARLDPAHAPHRPALRQGQDHARDALRSRQERRDRNALPRLSPRPL